MTAVNWKEKYRAEVEQATKIAEKINEGAIVRTRLLTDEEIRIIFIEKNYSYLKYIRI